MSNFYSVLGDSDDEETPKLAKTATGAGANGKSGDQKKSAPAPKASGGGNKTGGKPKSAPAASMSAVDSEVTKASERGVREAGGHGSKQRSENRNRQNRGDKAASRNNQRRSGDSDAQTKRVAKGGGGAHNWGNETEDVRKINKTGKIDDDEAADGGERATGPSEPEPEPEPEPVTFTLDEYMQKRKAAQANNEIFGKVQERKVTEKIEGIKLGSEQEDFLVVGGLKENKSGKTKNSKTKTVISATFQSAPSEKADDRDDRRGGRGGNVRPDGSTRTHRGRGLGGRGGGAKIDVSDKSMFPSL
jgi:hypothetical protein